jgi:hypothetical protein
MKTPLEVFDEFPPTLCRYLARKNNGRVKMSHSDIARVSGLERSTVAKLSKRTTWSGLTIDTIQRFSLACGVNLLSTARQKDFFKRRKKVHAKGVLHKELLVRTVQKFRNGSKTDAQPAPTS